MRIPRRRLGAVCSGWSHLECLGKLSVFGGVDSFVGGGRVRRQGGGVNIVQINIKRLQNNYLLSNINITE